MAEKYASEGVAEQALRSLRIRGDVDDQRDYDYVYILNPNIVTTIKKAKNAAELKAAIDKSMPMSGNMRSDTMNKATYVTAMQNGLWLEEASLQVEYDTYSAKVGTLSRAATNNNDDRKTFQLRYPGSTTESSHLPFQLGDTASVEGYPCTIIAIKDNAITLKFDHRHFSETFEQKRTDQFKVMFDHNIATFQVQHRAVMAGLKMFDDDFFFPGRNTPSHAIQLNADIKDNILTIDGAKVDLFNAKLNLHQKVAVKWALRNETGPQPLLIHGPPGMYFI